MDWLIGPVEVISLVVFVGYSVTAELDGGGSETVCQGGDTEGSCSVEAAGVYDLEYATWTVTVADDSGGGVSASASTDSLHLPLLSFGKEVTAADPTPFGTGEGEFFLPFAVAVHDGTAAMQGDAKKLRAAKWYLNSGGKL